MGKSDLRRMLYQPFGAAVLLIALLAGCFNVPAPSPEPVTPSNDRLSERVALVLSGRHAEALTYAGLYAVLADRIEAKSYDTTTEAATVAGRAADILQVPGVLRDIVNDELNPLLGKPQPLTPELCAKASEKLHALSAACKEAAK